MSETERVAAGPYKGLAPFGDSELDALLFFGREREREIVVANLIASRLTVLYGPSGVGKSSLLRASVARALRGLPERPVVVVFSSWTENPASGLTAAVCAEAGIPATATLHEALAGVGNRDAYLILDQAEEYFLYHGDGERDFEDELVSAVTEPLRVNLLLSLREDALAKLDRFKGRIPNLFGNSLRLDRLDREAGRAAIVRPLERWNELEGAQFEIEPALIDVVLDDVGTGQIKQGLSGVGASDGNGRPPAIEAPYLQLVMRKLWEVERSEGSERLREATLAQLGGAERIVAGLLEQASRELTTMQKDVAAELSRYLVTPSGTKIAHTTADLAEYAGVPEEDVRSVVRILVERRILRPSEGGRYEIFHDVLASEVLAWRARYLAERSLAQEREVAKMRHRRLVVVAGAAMVALAAMAALTVWAFSERRDARAKTILVHARELDATALARLRLDPELSLLLAVQAARMAPSAEVESVLRDALLTSRVRAVLPAKGPVTAASYSPDGRRILTASGDGHARLYDAGTHRLLRELDHGAPITAATFDPTSRLVATAGKDGVARIWDVSDGRLLRSFRHEAPVGFVAFDPRGDLLATTGGHAAKLWRVRFGGLAAALRTPKPVTSASFSPDGTLVLVIGRDRHGWLFPVSGGKPVHVLDQGGLVTSAAFSPGGKILATAGANRTARLWSIRTGKRLHELSGHVGWITRVAFSPRGGLLATASSDGTGRVWSATTGHVTAQLTGHSNPVEDIAFSPDGFSLVTGSTDGTAAVWKSADGGRRVLLAGHRDAAVEVSFSTDGREVLTASADGTARIWDPGTARELAPSHQSAPTKPAVTARAPDGTVASLRGNVVRLVGPSGERELRGHTAAVNSVAFSPDGSILVTSSRDHDARIWSLATGKSTLLRGHFGSVADARFSPDGRWIVTAGPITAGLWQVSTGQLVMYLRGPSSLLVAASFLRNSRTIVTSERDGAVREYTCLICGALPELLQLAKQRLAGTERRLTAEERKRYLE